MYKLLIVEDERWEREGLVEFIDWSELNIEIVGTAINGIQGLHMAKEKLPDIIITDIRMPKMDGLELTAKVKHFLPDCKIILITGYDDFMYAKEAIHMGVSDYLLKPVHKVQLLDALNKVLTLLYKNSQQVEYKRMIQAQLTRRFYDERERFLLGILKCKEQPRMTIEETSFTFDFRKTVAVVIRMSGLPILQEKGFCEMQQQFRAFYIFIREKVGNQGLTAVSDIEKNEIIICLKIKKEARDEINDILHQIQQWDIGVKMLEYAVGVGIMSNTVADFIRSFSKAQYALEHLFFMKDAKVLYYEDCQQQEEIEESSICDFLYSAPDYTRRLLNGVVSRGAQDVTEMTEELFDFIYSWPVGKSLVCNYLADFINELSILLSPYKDAINPMKHVGDDLPRAFQTCIRLDQLKAWVQSLLIYVNSFFIRNRKNKEEYIIDEAMNIISNEYTQCIGLEVIAHRLGVSPNYLGSLFIKFKGRRYTEVLMEYRMKRAEKMLVSTSEKIINIAKAVGFTNASYFCTVFKKSHGISPTDYREKYCYENRKEK